MVTLTSKRQITLPRAVTEALGLEVGSRIDFEVRLDGEVVLRKHVSRADIEAVRGCLQGKTPWTSTDEMMSVLRDDLSLAQDVSDSSE